MPCMTHVAQSTSIQQKRLTPSDRYMTVDPHDEISDPAATTAFCDIATWLSGIMSVCPLA